MMGRRQRPSTGSKGDDCGCYRTDYFESAKYFVDPFATAQLISATLSADVHVRKLDKITEPRYLY